MHSAVAYRITDMLSFYVRDAQAVAEVVYADRLHKGMIWQGPPACLNARLFPERAEIELSMDHLPASLEGDVFPPWQFGCLD